MSVETGIPYQNLINLYRRDCAEHHKELKLNGLLKEQCLQQ